MAIVIVRKLQAVILGFKILFDIVEALSLAGKVMIIKSGEGKSDVVTLTDISPI